jgi:hypothetical protein
MKRLRMIPWILAVILAGCVPTLYTWSPDGRWMTVLSSSGLRLSDPDGNLSSTTIPGVNNAAWFPDSKQLLVARQIDVKTWVELTKYLNTDQTQQITDAAVHLRQSLMAYDWTAPNANDWNKFTQSLDDQDDAPRYAQSMKNFEIAIAMYVRDHADVTLQQKVPAERWKELVELSQPVQSIEVYGVDPLKQTPAAQLMTTLHGIRCLRVSPTGAAAIVVTDTAVDHACDLWVVAADGKQLPVKISDSSASAPDWSPDGRSVVFIQSATQPVAGDAAQLGSLSRVTIMGDDGELLPKPAVTDDLVGLVYNEWSRVRCLQDGRIFFASAQITLPATAADMPDKPQLFSLAPGSMAAVTRLFPKEVDKLVGDSPQFFEVSPDGRHVAIPDQTGKVFVVDLQSGDVITAQGQPVPSTDSNHQPSLLTVPQWRSDDELTFMAPGENSHPNVVLWSISKNDSKSLSAAWPPGTIEDNSTTQPATKP